MEFLKTHKLYPLIFSINIDESNVIDRKMHVYNVLRSFWYKFRLSDDMKTIFPDVEIPLEFFEYNPVYKNIHFENASNLFGVFKKIFIDEKEKIKNSLILLGNKKDFDKTIEFKIIKEIDDETLEKIQKLEVNEEIEIVNKFMMYYKEYDTNVIENFPEICESPDYKNGYYIFYMFVEEN
jgi:hypothetical protein